MMAPIVQRIPVLLLNLDINKTLIAEDMSTNKTLEYTLSSALAEKIVHVWDQHHPAMSYREYVDKVLAPTDKEKQREYMGGFVSFIEKSDHPERFKVVDSYQSSLSKMNGQYLIPSFVKLIKKMQEQQIDFRIILRTFGGDIRVGKITQEIDRILDGSRVEYWGSFKGKTLSIKQGPTIEKVEEVYRFFQESSGHIAIQDDWNIWNEDGERGRSGKHFIFDPNDRKVLSVFIDDNINTNPHSEFNIVQPMHLDGSKVSVHHYLGRNIFVADVIEAILNDDYFIDIINQALTMENHDVRVLKQYNSQITN